MKYFFKFFLFSAVLAVCAASHTAYAANYADTIDELTNCHTQSIFNMELNAPFSKDLCGINETVNPENGNLSLDFALFNLQGRATQSSVRLSLLYSASSASFKTETAKYNSSSADYDNTTADKTSFEQSLYSFGVGWQINLPYIEKTNERNKTETYVHLPSGQVYIADFSEKCGLRGYMLKDVQYTENKLVYSDGSIYEFNSEGYLVKSADRFGNIVSYQWSGAAVRLLEKVYDNCGNCVNIAYSNSAVTLTCRDRIYTIFRSAAPGGGFKIDSITDPLGRKTSFSYNAREISFNYFGSFTGETNTYLLLASVCFPTGLASHYTYDLPKKWLYEKNNGFIEYPRLASRRDSDGKSVRNELLYSYNRSFDGYPDYTPESLPKTYTYSAAFKDINGLTTTYVYNSNHDMIKKFSSVGGRKISAEERTFSTKTRMPILFKETFYNSSGTPRSVYTSTVFDSRGNVVKTDKYGPGEKSGTNISTYEYSRSNNLCIAETHKKDKETTVTVRRSLNSGGNAFAAEMLCENGKLIKTTLYSYDSYGNCIKKKEETSPSVFSITSYEYSSLYSSRFPTSVTVKTTDADSRPLSYTTEFTYDSFGNCLSKTDSCKTVYTTYDKLNRIVEEKLEDGSVRTTTYDDLNNTVFTVDAAGKKLLYSYEKYGKLKSVKDTVSGGILYLCSYNSVGLPISETDALSSKVSYSYDSVGRVTSLVLSDKNKNILRRRQISYNEAYKGGVLLTVSEGSPARITEYAFDSMDNLIRKSRISGGEIRSEIMTYDFFGNMLSKTTPGGSTTAYAYDIFGNPLKEILPDGNINFYEYDFLGNILSVTNPLGEKKEYVFDSLGRNIKTVFPCDGASAVTKMYYDSRGNLTSVISPNGGKTENTYNARGFLVRERVYSSYDEYIQTDYTYNKEGSLTSSDVSGTGGNTHTLRTYSLDVYGRPIAETDSLGNSSFYEYDLFGNPVKLTDREGRSISYVYDGAGRLLKKTSSDGFIEYTYDEFDNILSLSNEKETYFYEYNGFGEVVRAQRGKTKHTYAYTPDGLLKSHTVSDSGIPTAVYGFLYDKRGNPIKFSMPGDTETVTYDSVGRVVKKQLSSTGAEKLYTYYPDGMLKKQTTRLAGNIVYSEFCRYDRCGNKILSDKNNAVRKYRYDLANRLKGVDNPDGSITEYEFDSCGNIKLEYCVTDRYTEKTSFFYDSENRLLMKDGASAVTMQYDKNGNLIKRTDGIGQAAAVSHFGYDAFGRLTSFSRDSANAKYTYNPEGMRSGKTVNEISTRYIYDNGNILSSVSDGSYTSYNRGTELISVSQYGKEKLYYQTDSHGDVTALHTPDGTEAHSYQYTAYGDEVRAAQPSFGENVTSQLWQTEVTADQNPFRYCGEYTDPETGLIYLRNRYYDPTVGRFISEDPAKDGMNWYVYCGNNPVNCVDLNGLEYAPIRDIAGSYNVAFGKNPKYEFGEAYGKGFVMVTIDKYCRAFYFDGTIREPIYDDNGYEIKNNWIKVADNLNGSLNLQRSAFVVAMGMTNDGTATVQTSDTFYVNDLTAMLDFASYIKDSISDANDIKDVYDIFGKAPVVGKTIRNLAVLNKLSNAIKNGEILSTGNYRSEAVTVQRGRYKHITATMYGVDEKTKYYQFFVKFPSWNGIPSAPEYK